MRKVIVKRAIVKRTRDLPWEVFLGPVQIKVPATVDEITPLVIQLVERYPAIARRTAEQQTAAQKSVANAPKTRPRNNKTAVKRAA
jgi:hypothetical protein